MRVVIWSVILANGNAEEVFDPITKKPKTSHTVNPVPCWFYDNTKNATLYQLKQLHDAGLSNVAPTIAKLFGITDLPVSWRQPLIQDPIEREGFKNRSKLYAI